MATVIVKMAVLSAMALFVGIPVSLFIPANGQGTDPDLYCFAVNGAGGLWSCYTKADAPAGLVPVWVGPESLVPREAR